MAPLVVLVAVWFTLPRCQAVQGCDTLLVVCSETTCDTVIRCLPENALSRVRLYARTRWGLSALLLRDKDVRGRAGLRDSLAVPLDSLATVWVATTDSAGNESCWSNGVTVNSPVTSVGGGRGHGPPSSVHWYDLAGRRVRMPTHSGVWFERRVWPDSVGTRKLVIVR